MYTELINSFYEAADPVRAKGMKAYMKNQFEFLGIMKDDRVKISRDFMKSAAKGGRIDWIFIDQCWNLPEREFQYLALDYLIKLKKYLLADNMERIAQLIIRKPWWDTVDLIASHLVGWLCQDNRALIDRYIKPWSQSENLWLRRTAILFQLKYKENTDLALLTEIIGYNQECEEFFIAKSIGWILREYSKTDLEWVRDFIKSHNLRKLSIREGSKYL